MPGFITEVRLENSYWTDLYENLFAQKINTVNVDDIYYCLNYFLF
ncbi:hypothetical protein OLK001_19700 [Synechocystis sp. LKSZ1]